MCETRQTVDNDSIPHVLIHPQLELQLQSIFNEWCFKVFLFCPV